jgi:hypothetical protein
VAVEDFTKIFLDDVELRSFRTGRDLLVKAAVECAGIVAVLRGVSRDVFLSRLDEGTAARIAFNPYEVSPEAAA